jgi:hypothetical protein
MSNLYITQGHFSDANLLASLLLIGQFHPFYNYSLGLMIKKIRTQLRHKTCVMAWEDDQLIGYIGWIVVNDNEAQTWLLHGGDVPSPQWKTGDAVIVTMLACKNPYYLRFLLRYATQLDKGKKAYRLRTFNNGRPEMRRPPVNKR